MITKAAYSRNRSVAQTVGALLITEVDGSSPSRPILDFSVKERVCSSDGQNTADKGKVDGSSPSRPILDFSVITKAAYSRNRSVAQTVGALLIRARSAVQVHPDPF